MLIAKIYIYQNKTNVLMLTTLTGTPRYRNIVFAAGYNILVHWLCRSSQIPKSRYEEGTKLNVSCMKNTSLYTR
jgi:hypothetical protein